MINLFQKTITDYDKIAPYFSQTRQNLWPEFSLFEKYLTPNLLVLDLGCGNGRLSTLIKNKNCDYIGVDNSAGQLKEAQKNHPDSKFLWGDLLDIPLGEASVDQIWCIAAFHHLPDRDSRQKALEEMRRVLKKDGILILTNWNLFQKKYRFYLFQAWFAWINHFGLQYGWKDTFIPWSSGGKKLADRYVHAFTSGEIKRLLRQNQFKILENFYSRKTGKSNLFQGYNLCHVAKKN